MIDHELEMSKCSGLGVKWLTNDKLEDIDKIHIIIWIM